MRNCRREDARIQEVIWELELLPDELLDEVLEFARYLKARRARTHDALLSEAALAREWDTPEEDEAWQDL